LNVYYFIIILNANFFLKKKLLKSYQYNEKDTVNYIVLFLFHSRKRVLVWSVLFFFFVLYEVSPSYETSCQSVIEQLSLSSINWTIAERCKAWREFKLAMTIILVACRTRPGIRIFDVLPPSLSFFSLSFPFLVSSSSSSSFCLGFLWPWDVVFLSN
jgi:hypothetical protein